MYLKHLTWQCAFMSESLCGDKMSLCSWSIVRGFRDLPLLQKAAHQRLLRASATSQQKAETVADI